MKINPFSRRRFLGRTAALSFLFSSVSPAWAKLSWIGYPRLLQGPMIGSVSHEHIDVWVRASGEHKVWLEYCEDRQLSDALQTKVVTPRKSNDYTGRLTMKGLTPDTTYYYRVMVDNPEKPNKPDLHLGRLGAFSTKTSPAPQTKSKFQIAFGSCARVQFDGIQPIWDPVALAEPDLFLWLGDNIYGDSLNPKILAEMYRRQRDVPSAQKVQRSVPQLAIWDDHDYGLNDHDKRNPIKHEALKVFKNYWANPAYGLEDTPGVFFKTSYGGVDLFFLDVRSYRDPNHAEDLASKTMLGRKQLEWLKSVLKESSALFKLVVSGSAWNEAKGPKADSWSSYLTERNALFDFISDENIEGIVLLSGDTHIGEVNAIPWSSNGGYDFYEFVSSPLAQETSVSWRNYKPIHRMREIYDGGPNFGLISFDMTKEDPELIFALRNVRGEIVRKPLMLSASQLRNGVKSWPGKMDKRAKKLFEKSFNKS